MRPALFALLFTSLAVSHAAQAQDRPTSSGSGFVVSDDRALTNFHVVKGCSRLIARNARGQTATVTTVATDPQRDLALLGVPAHIVPPLSFRDSPAVARGEAVVTYGFPLTGLLSSGPSLTTGNISALAGLRDDPAQYQISAPVQPGNSGGPLLDMQGHVVGVVVAKLNALQVARMTGGDIPQNVNFAIKGEQAAAFLTEKNVTLHRAASTGDALRADQVGEIANASVLFIECYGGARPAAAPAAAPAKAANDPSFRLLNRADQKLTELYATPSGRANWGRNRLEAPLAPNAAMQFRLPADGNCLYDLKVVFADGRLRERRNTNLCQMTALPVH